jgi:hypothetical protein
MVCPQKATQKNMFGRLFFSLRHAMARRLHLGTVDATTFDLASLVEAAAEHYDHITCDVVGGQGSVGHELAQRMSRRQDHENYVRMQRSRVFQETVSYALSLDVLSRSGQSVKQTVPLVFPKYDGGFDQYRETQVHSGQTDVRWWVGNASHVMTKEEHLPSVEEKGRLAAHMQDLIDQSLATEGRASDLPDTMLPYPRIYLDHPPDFGESSPITLQGSLDTPVPFDDKTRFRVRAQGLAGTKGEALVSQVFTGKDVRDAMQRDFKDRKEMLKALQQRIDGEATDARLSVHSTRTLCGGASFRMGSGVPLTGQLKMLMAHLATTGPARKRTLTGLMVCLHFERPARRADDAEVCATCLDDVQGEAWTCHVCTKPQHVGCFEQWRQQCHKTKCIVTCPNCRAAVRADA